MNKNQDPKEKDATGFRKLTLAQVGDSSEKVDKYILLTAILSFVLFFSGLATHFISIRIQAAALLFAGGLFLLNVFILLENAGRTNI